MSDYTPDTENVRRGWTLFWQKSQHEARAAEFDRWLAAHDREVAERCAVIAEGIPGFVRAFEGESDYMAGGNDAREVIAAEIRALFPAPTPVTEENQT